MLDFGSFWGGDQQSSLYVHSGPRGQQEGRSSTEVVNRLLIPKDGHLRNICVQDAWLTYRGVSPVQRGNIGR